MKKFLLLFAIAIVFTTFAHAAIRRVGFFLAPVANVDYPSLQAAHDASNPGDTIMIMPAAYVNCNISKRLVLVGPGYLLDSTNAGNGGLQANTSNNQYSGADLKFLPGCSGTILEGISTGEIDFNDNSTTDTILIERCDLKQNTYFNGNSGNITIQQCVIEGGLYANGPSTPNFTIANLSLLNCLIYNNASYPSTQINFSQSNYSVHGTMANCVDVSYAETIDIPGGAWLVTNSVFSAGLIAFYAGGNTDVSNIVFIDNISCNSGNPFDNSGTNSGNLVSTWSTVFSLQGSYDGKYMLAAGSPAIGAGKNGTAATDIGIFGGAWPYILSGIPSVPTIYRISSPQGATPTGNTEEVDLSTRSNN